MPFGFAWKAASAIVPRVGYTFDIRRVLADLLGGVVLSQLHRARYRGKEGEKPAARPMTSRTSTTPAHDPKSLKDLVRLPMVAGNCHDPRPLSSFISP